MHARHDAPRPHLSADDDRAEFGPRPFDDDFPGPAADALMSTIHLDGSRGEGGGQILRSALTLSILTGKPFSIDRIRAGRDVPGLRPQHLVAVEAASKVSGAGVEGAKVGSKELTFRPGPVEAADLSIDIGTAGATGLVLQTIHLPIALRAASGVRVSLSGGTFNLSAPSFPFLESTWRGYLAAIGLPVGLGMPMAGYYPKGQGRLEAWIEPGTPRPLVLEARGPVTRVRCAAEVSNLDPSIARRMAERARKAIEARGFEVDAEVSERPAAPHVRGTSLTLSAEFLDAPPATFVGLGKLGKPAEAVADETLAELFDHLDEPGGAVDLHTADQILLPLAFAEGRSVYTVARVTEHLRTNAQTIRAFLDRPIRIEESAGSNLGRVVVG